MSSDRTVEHEIEVSGTPEQVWQAIATGQGITGWFVPTKVEERAGGAFELDFGVRPDEASSIQEVQFLRRQGLASQRQSSLALCEVTNMAKRRQSDRQAATRVK